MCHNETVWATLIAFLSTQSYNHTGLLPTLVHTDTQFHQILSDTTSVFPSKLAGREGSPSPSRGTPELFPALEEFSSSVDGEAVCLCTLCPAVLLLLLEAISFGFSCVLVILPNWYVAHT